MKTVFQLLVAGLVTGFTYTQSACAQYPGFIPVPQRSAGYYGNPYGGNYQPYQPPHHHNHHYHSPNVVPNYTSMYGGGFGYAPQPAVVSTPNVYTTNNYYQSQSRNHPWHLGHYLLGH